MKKSALLALLLILVPAIRGSCQEAQEDMPKIYWEVAGEYEFYIPKSYVLVRVFVDKGAFWTKDEGASAAERIIPVDLDGLLFKIDDPKKEQYLRFLRDSNGHISGCLLKTKGGETDQEICGKRITRKARPIDALCSVQELKEDFQKAWEAMERLHPALYEFTDKETFERLYKQQLSLIDKPMTGQEFYAVLAPLVVAIGCGHSRLLPADRFWEGAPGGCFPLGLLFSQSKAYVTRHFEPDLPVPLGSEILSINGQPMSDFLRWAKPCISSDGLRDPWKWVMLGKWFHIYAAVRFGFPKTYFVTYLAPGEEEAFRVELNSIERKVILDDYSKGPYRVPSVDSNLSFEILKDRSTGILTIGHFDYYREDDLKRYKAFIDDAFVQIRQGGVACLILDLRGNNGGSPFATTHLLSYLEAEPLLYFTKEYGGGYEVLAKPIPRADLAFDGRLFILIDGGCFSSTGHFCGLLRYRKIGTFVGTETGGTFECNDASHLVNLWNTGLKLYLARITFTAAVQDMTETTGITPDYPVQPRIEDIASGRDTIKECVFALIEELKGEREAEKEKIAQTISSVIGWAKDKDLDLFFSVIANDEDYISVTPGQRVIKRFEDVKQNVPFWMSPEFKYVRHELKDLEIHFARCGEVAWFYCVLDDINTYKGEPACWENTRWTGVVEKRDGRWVVVQQHFSFASER